jgi:hypothetical protein
MEDDQETRVALLSLIPRRKERRAAPVLVPAPSAVMKS